MPLQLNKSTLHSSAIRNAFSYQSSSSIVFTSKLQTSPMAGSDDETSYNDHYRKFLVKRKENVKGQFIASSQIHFQLKQKLETLMEEMRDIDAEIAKCDKEARNKNKEQNSKTVEDGENKDKGLEIGSDFKSPIDLDSDTDEEPLRKKRIVSVKGKGCQSKGECNKFT